MDISPTLVGQILNTLLIIGSILSFGLGASTWLKNKTSTMHRFFALSGVSISIWFLGSFFMFRNCASESAAYMWDRIIYCAVLFIPVFMFRFGMELSQKKSAVFKFFLYLGYGIVSVLISILVFAPQLIISGFFQYAWGCHAIAQPGHTWFLAYFASYVSMAFWMIYIAWKNSSDVAVKVQSRFFFYSSFFLIMGSLEFLPAYKIGMFPFGYIFPLVWFSVLAYAITRYQLLEFKVIATDVLVGMIIFIVLVFTIISESLSDFAVRGVFFALICVFGWLAISGVHRQVDEKERLGAMVKERTRELEEAKGIAEERAKELERWYNLTVGRELRMAELKKKIDEMEDKIKKQ